MIGKIIIESIETVIVKFWNELVKNQVSTVRIGGEMYERNNHITHKQKT